MIRNTRRHRSLMGASAAAIATSLLLAGGAMAQTATSTIRGNVSDQGQAEAGAQIVARDSASGYVSRATANASGNYVLSGLRPGSYEVTVTTADGQSTTETVSIGVGQTGTLDVDVPAPPPASPMWPKSSSWPASWLTLALPKSRPTSAAPRSTPCRRSAATS
ncbi:carboxypeptidase-like regulatory domain-containing protein [Brevundimonas denitrificans]|uniref:carboxypeptidase-like regulatory domain-containing protein n=1 Tax=Brevundimonas denitrificans TaxID=1443434 RepID=UPI00223B123B|nr:carboxypeptidase-like regulatory domain-containing protein [Brevundimonas denitrificans]